MTGFLSAFSMLLLELLLPFSRGPVEGSRNLVMMSYTQEAWALLSIGEKVTLNLSNHWIKLPQSKSRFIMHTLGDYKLQNTLSGARSSVLRSASLFEVDIFLDSAKKLRCHHGPEPPRSYVSGDCTLSSLVQILPNDSYLILDIKTDFIATATIVLDEISSSHVRSHASKIVFQLYQPSHVRWFERAWRMYPGLIKNQPIVTLYRTRSRAPFVAKVLPRYVAALTFPIDRDDLIGLESKIFGLNVKPYYVHPAKTCWQYYQSRLRGVDGVYGPNSLLSCPSLPWAVDPFSEPIESR